MIFRQWYSPLCQFACSFLRDKEESEELVQAAFVQFWEKRSEIQIESSLKSYLFRSIRNASLNHLKHLKVRSDHARHVKSASVSDAAWAAEGVLTEELQVRIEMALSRLPEQCGLVFRMSRMEEKKYSEIADELGISIKTVENHMGKALKLMREELKDYLVLLLVFLMMQD